MISFETSIRVRYAETDKMGYVYYGNYATYFEVARVEALRSIGISYKKLEDDGVMLPVYKYSTSFYEMAAGPIAERNQDATIYVGGLDEKVNETLLWELFVQAGPVGKFHYYFIIEDSCYL
mgnify:CR=1 FL=1